MSKKEKTSPEPKAAKVVTSTVTRPTVVLPNPLAIQRGLNQIVETLNDPAYQEQLTKMTQASVTNSVQTLMKLGQVANNMSKLDSKGWDALMSSSVNDLMRVYLQFNSDLLVLLQKLSKNTVDVLANAVPAKEESDSSPQS